MGIKDFQLQIRKGKVVSRNPFVNLGQETEDLVKIVVAIFDVEGFTKFFNKIPINKNIVTSSFINGLLNWFHYNFHEVFRFSPVFGKFLGDGILMIWETARQDMPDKVITGLMNHCWNMVYSCETKYVPEFVKKIGKRWRIEYPTKLKVGLSLGHAVKYTRRGKVSDYISESINIASRLVKFHEHIRFIAHSDLVFGRLPEKHLYVQKSIELRGIGEISVYIDKDYYIAAGSPKEFKDLID